MINKVRKRLKIWFAAGIIGTIAISSASIMGCGPEKSPKIDAENKGITVEKVLENSYEMEGGKISEEEIVSIEKSSNNKDNKEIETSPVKKQKTEQAYAVYILKNDF